jgi:UDP-glucuronate decarboxylase
LVADGHEVLCVDNFSTGRKENLCEPLKMPNFSFLHGDVECPFDAQADQIYHLACPASPAAYQRDPVRTTRTAVFGAANLLDIALRNSAKVLLASTSEIYGDPEIHPQSEGYCGRTNTDSVRACYIEGKRCAESLFFDYRRQYGLDTKVIRIFNTYGPGMAPDDGRVVSNFIIQALKGEDITIYGDGSQTRAFCYVDDMLNGIIRMMESAEHFVGAVNLGNPHECEIGRLAEAIIHLCNSPSRITYLAMQADDPKRRCPDISLARTKLYWQPGVSLEDGLKETIKYFRSLCT